MKHPDFYGLNVFDISTLYSLLVPFPGPWRTFVNPMRSDGLFVGQDLPIMPYPRQHGWRSIGYDPYRRPDGLSYPATPQGSIGLPWQLPCDMAERLVAMLNRTQR